MSEQFLNGKVSFYCGDSREVLKSIPDNSIDSVVTDPPYALVSIVKRFGGKNAAPVKVKRIDGQGGSPYLRASSGFMGKQWDTGETAFAEEFWREVLRVLKPGGHVVAFSGTRTYHRMACAIEDAGFEIRDSLQWLYGSGFPKSHDVSKAIDRHNGDERPTVGSKSVSRVMDGSDLVGGNVRAGTIDVTSAASAASAAWDGWGTALKPACEPIVLARKPLIGTVAENVLAHGTGALNIDACRVGSDTRSRSRSTGQQISENTSMAGANYSREIVGTVEGRWPANLIHDGSDEVTELFPETGPAKASMRGEKTSEGTHEGWARESHKGFDSVRGHDDAGGSAARFFYTAKADSQDRIGSKHPTVKPVDLMQWLVRLVTPKGGTVLDPFGGTGTTAEAAFREGMRCVLIEREEEYQADIRRRMALCLSGPDERARESIKARMKDKPQDAGPLFSGSETPPPHGQTDLRSLRGRTIGPTGLRR